MMHYTLVQAIISFEEKPKIARVKWFKKIGGSEWLIIVPSKIGLRELVDILEKILFCLITNDFLSDAVEFEMV